MLKVDIDEILYVISLPKLINYRKACYSFVEHKNLFLTKVVYAYA